MGPRAPSAATRRRRTSFELLIKFSRFALTAGEGARGPSKSGYQRPNLEFQTDDYLLTVVSNLDISKQDWAGTAVLFQRKVTVEHA